MTLGGGGRGTTSGGLTRHPCVQRDFGPHHPFLEPRRVRSPMPAVAAATKWERRNWMSNNIRTDLYCALLLRPGGRDDGGRRARRQGRKNVVFLAAPQPSSFQSVLFVLQHALPPFRTRHAAGKGSLSSAVLFWEKNRSRSALSSPSLFVFNLGLLCK